MLFGGYEFLLKIDEGFSAFCTVAGVAGGCDDFCVLSFESSRRSSTSSACSLLELLGASGSGENCTPYCPCFLKPSPAAVVAVASPPLAALAGWKGSEPKLMDYCCCFISSVISKSSSIRFLSFFACCCL